MTQSEAKVDLLTKLIAETEQSPLSSQLQAATLQCTAKPCELYPDTADISETGLELEQRCGSLEGTIYPALCESVIREKTYLKDEIQELQRILEEMREKENKWRSEAAKWRQKHIVERRKPVTWS